MNDLLTSEGKTQTSTNNVRTPTEAAAVLPRSSEVKFSKEFRHLEARRIVSTAIFDALRAAGISQTALARRLGVAQSTVSRVARGECDLRVSTLLKYLNACGADFEVSVKRCKTKL